LHLETKNYLDFSNGHTYSERLDKLLKDIGTGKGTMLPEQYRQTYVTAPPPARQFCGATEATGGPGRSAQCAFDGRFQSSHRFDGTAGYGRFGQDGLGTGFV